MRRSASTTTATHRRVSVVTEGACDVWVAPSRRSRRTRATFDALLSPAERAQVERFRAEERTAPAHGVPRAPAAANRPLPRSRPSAPRPRPALPRLRRGPRQAPAEGRRSTGLLGRPLRRPARLRLRRRRSGGRRRRRLDGQVDPSTDLMEFVLTPGERRSVEEAPVARRPGLFLGYWTAKEAVVKQLGTGVSVPLTSVAVGSPGSSRRSSSTSTDAATRRCGSGTWTSVPPTRRPSRPPTRSRGYALPRCPRASSPERAEPPAAGRSGSAHRVGQADREPVASASEPRASSS